MKYIIPILILGAIIYFGVSQSEEQIDGNETLQVDNILFHKVVPEQEVLVKVNDSLESVLISEHISYLYVSDTEVPTEKDEDISKRTKSAKFFSKDGKTSAKFYTGEPFYHNEKEDKWYRTKTATTTVEAFNTEALGAETTVYSGAGDGDANTSFHYNWNAAHDSAGKGAAYGSVDHYCQVGTYPIVGYLIYRTFFPFDTSAINGAIINSAVFHFKVVTLGGLTDYRCVETTQADETELVNADFTECGAVDNPTNLSTDQTIFNNGWKSFTLNDAGEAAVTNSSVATGWTTLGIRDATYDSKDADPGTNDYYIRIFTSENTEDPDATPYLVVDYTEVEEGEEEDIVPEIQIIIIE